jgi:hypothetical protein
MLRARPISWNEIRHNAIKFSRDWTGATSESAEKQTFWNEFFQVFGVSRRAVASFEESVKTISGDYGYIDLFWPGIVLVEYKSPVMSSFRISTPSHCMTWSLKIKKVCRCLKIAASPRFNFRSPNFTNTSTPSPSFPVSSNRQIIWLGFAKFVDA